MKPEKRRRTTKGCDSTGFGEWSSDHISWRAHRKFGFQDGIGHNQVTRKIEPWRGKNNHSGDSRQENGFPIPPDAVPKRRQTVERRKEGNPRNWAYGWVYLSKMWRGHFPRLRPVSILREKTKVRIEWDDANDTPENVRDSDERIVMEPSKHPQPSQPPQKSRANRSYKAIIVVVIICSLLAGGITRAQREAYQASVM